MAAATFTIEPEGPFDLRLAAGFGFGPDSGRPEAQVPLMRLASCQQVSAVDVDDGAGRVRQVALVQQVLHHGPC